MTQKNLAQDIKNYESLLAEMKMVNAVAFSRKI